MKMRTLILTSSIACLLLGAAEAETRGWSLKNGKTVEAEFMNIIGEKISLKTLKGKIIKVSASDLSSEDLTYIELASPPKLELSISKNSKARVFPDTLSNEIPTSDYYNFKAVIKKKSNKKYSFELTAELFVIGREKIGDKHTLLDYQKASFTLENKSGSVFELPSRTIEMMQFVQNGQLVGEEYAGYMIVVTDSRGEMIAHVTKRDGWLTIIDKLRVLPVRKYFDDEGERCFTTPPKRWY